MAQSCIGIDLGGTFIKFVTLDEDYAASEVFQLPTPDSREGVVEQMAVGAREAMARNGLSHDDVTGVGIGSPGPLDTETGVILALPNIPGMDNVPIRDLISAELSLPTTLENDANAAAYGEYISGAGRGDANMVLLTLGTGLGSGIIQDGRILRGSHGVGGEIGHIIIVPDGEPCGCGQRGCIERYCSATFMAQRAARRIASGDEATSLRALLADKGELDARDINAARRDGDALAGEVWDEALRYLAQGCVTISRIFDPDRIVLSGGLTNAGDDLLVPLREHFAAMHWTLTEVATELAISTLGSDAGAIGAAGVAWRATG